VIKLNNIFPPFYVGKHVINNCQC